MQNESERLGGIPNKVPHLCCPFLLTPLEDASTWLFCGVKGNGGGRTALCNCALSFCACKC